MADPLLNKHRRHSFGESNSSASSHEIGYVVQVQVILNAKGYPNWIIGSKITALFLNGWILPIGSAINGATPSSFTAFPGCTVCTAGWDAVEVLNDEEESMDPGLELTMASSLLFPAAWRTSSWLPYCFWTLYKLLFCFRMCLFYGPISILF